MAKRKGWYSIKELPDPGPTFDGDGKPRREHFQIRLANLNRMNEENMRRTGQIIKGHKQTLDAILKEAEQLGLSSADVMDTRPQEDRIKALLEQAMEEPQIFLGDGKEDFDRTLDILEEQMRSSVELTEMEMQTRREQADHAAADRLSRRRDAGKAWLRRLQRIKRLRELVHHPIPPAKSRKHWGEYTVEAWEASHLARHIVYVHRSDMPDFAKRREAPIIRIAKHHAKYLVDIWEAEHGAQLFGAGGWSFDGVNVGYYDESMPDGGWKKEAYECWGIILIGPPRHGKTVLGTGYTSRAAGRNPSMQGAIVHAVDGEAKKRLGNVAACFNPDTGAGKRFLTFYPHQLDKRDNNSTYLRIRNTERTQDPTLRAAGVGASVGGSNFDYQWWDDAVDRDKAMQPTERERGRKRLSQVWLPRRQGRRPFVLITATIWHNEDGVNSLINTARQGEVPLAVSIQAVGGPKTNPPFFAIWPEFYPPSTLRSLYYAMKDPVGWSAQYMANPRTEEMQHVRRLAYYVSDISRCKDPPAWAIEAYHQHLEFLETCERHLSIDPAATNKIGSDQAGIWYAGVGPVRSYAKSESGGMVYGSRTVIRHLGATQFHANQSQGVEHAMHYISTHKVDKLHVETASGHWATYEMFVSAGIPSSHIITHTPKANNNKIQRLKSVAPMLDDSIKDHGLGGAVVEFPGVLNEHGELVPDESIYWLTMQILDAGVTGDDHCLDAVTQTCEFLATQVPAGAGELTHHVNAARRQLSERQQRLREQYQSENQEPASAEEEDWKWACRRN
jgi:hypothetical protein